MHDEVLMSYREYKNFNGSFYGEWRSKSGELHREGAPAKINYYSNGSVEWEIFFFNGKRHREDGPSEIAYYTNGTITFESFYFNGVHLGENKYGFWTLWDRLTEEGRQAHSLLKYLAKYS
jgi:antitoxin component YwqK of YwqJK toxin-antitoxin module